MLCYFLLWTLFNIIAKVVLSFLTYTIFCLPILNASDEAPSADQGTEDPKTVHLFSAEFVASLPLPPTCPLMRWLKRTSAAAAKSL